MLHLRGYAMKRQKRDRVERAYTKGYLAGIKGRNKQECPHQALEARYNWQSGWHEGHNDLIEGRTGINVLDKSF